MRPALIGAIPALALAAGAASAQTEADRGFEDFAKRYVHEFPLLSPVSATLLGDHRFDAELDEVSPAAREREVAFARRILEELDRFDRARLSRAQQVDAALLENRLRYDLWQLEELEEWAWNPLVYTQVAGDAVYGLVAREFAPLEQRLESAASRLERLPRLLEGVRAALVPARVPRVHAETAVKQNRGILSILEHMVKPHAASLAPAPRARLESAMKTASAAVEKHQEWLEKDLVPHAAGEFRIGRERYDRKLAFTLQSSLGRQEIDRLARAELARVRREMYEIAKEVYRKEYPYTKLPNEPGEDYRQAVTRAALEIAYRDLPGRTEIVETAKKALDRVTAFVREKDLITLSPDPVEIIVMPEFRRGVALAYCDSPGPLDVGQKTFYAVAPLPEDWTDAQVRSFLREYNIRSVQNLTVHEAVPGHYLQIAHSNRYPSTLRAVLSSGTFVEGWAVYTEHMLLEEGFLAEDPLYKLVVLKWYLRATANAIIDQAVHAGTMSREEALELMIEGTFQEEREAAGKWTRAQLTSAQLSTYFVGREDHMALRREAQKRQGAAFRLKAYHDAVLSFGSPPVKHARALLLDEPVPR